MNYDQDSIFQFFLPIIDIQTPYFFWSLLTLAIPLLFLLGWYLRIKALANLSKMNSCQLVKRPAWIAAILAVSCFVCVFIMAQVQKRICAEQQKEAEKAFGKGVDCETFIATIPFTPSNAQEHFWEQIITLTHMMEPPPIAYDNLRVLCESNGNLDKIQQIQDANAKYSHELDLLSNRQIPSYKKDFSSQAIFEWQFPYLGSLRSIIVNNISRIALAVRKNDKAEALRLYQQNLKYIHFMAKDPFTIGYLVNLALIAQNNAALAIMDEAGIFNADERRVRSAELEEIINALKQAESNVVYAEYVSINNFFNLLATDYHFNAYQNKTIPVSLNATQWFLPQIQWLFYKEHSTYNQYALKNQTFAELATNMPEKPCVFMEMPLRIFGTLKSRADNSIAKLTGTTILLAINSFHDKYEKYPEKLEELVPEFMDLIPLDPRTNEPYRYLRTTLIKYLPSIHSPFDTPQENKEVIENEHFEMDAILLLPNDGATENQFFASPIDRRRAMNKVVYTIDPKSVRSITR